MIVFLLLKTKVCRGRDLNTKIPVKIVTSKTTRIIIDICFCFIVISSKIRKNNLFQVAFGQGIFLYNVFSLRNSEGIIWYLKKTGMSYIHVKSSWKAEETRKYTFFAQQEKSQKVANLAICPMGIQLVSTNELNYHI